LDNLFTLWFCAVFLQSRVSRGFHRKGATFLFRNSPNFGNPRSGHFHQLDKSAQTKTELLRDALSGLKSDMCGILASLPKTSGRLAA